MALSPDGFTESIRRYRRAARDLIVLEPAAERGSQPIRYECHECALTFESDPAGGVREIDA